MRKKIVSPFFSIGSAALILNLTLAVSAGWAGEISPGKYLCVTSHLSGIEYNKDGTVSTGNFTPTDGSFVLNIFPVGPIRADCSKDKKREDYWYSCLARTGAKVGDSWVLHGNNYNQFNAMVGGDELSLFTDEVGNVGFTYVEGIFPHARGWFVSDGKCSKL